VSVVCVFVCICCVGVCVSLCGCVGVCGAGGGRFQFFIFPLLYSESIRLAFTPNRAALQESRLSDNAKCDSCSL
jgi:hypothetical protein